MSTDSHNTLALYRLDKIAKLEAQLRTLHNEHNLAVSDDRARLRGLVAQVERALRWQRSRVRPGDKFLTPRGLENAKHHD